jgi:NAD(P)-dependent dehydrogenase (short-subunit alcohol dehydrogenase family)
MPYGSMKAADISLKWSLARALAPHNVTVNCVCPGFVYTPLWELGATARLHMIRGAKARRREVPERFAAEDIETLTPKAFCLKYIVRPGDT